MTMETLQFIKIHSFIPSLGGAVLGGPAGSGPMGIPPPSGGGSSTMSVNSASTGISTMLAGGMSSAGSTASSSSELPLLRPADPKFAFGDINTTSLNGIVPHITIDPRLTLFKEHPDLIQLVKISIEKSIQVSDICLVHSSIHCNSSNIHCNS